MQAGRWTLDGCLGVDSDFSHPGTFPTQTPNGVARIRQRRGFTLLVDLLLN